MGENKVQETLDTLIEYSKNNHNENSLFLLPEHISGHIANNQEYNLEHDVDAFDYIYEVGHLANMHNWTKHTSGKHVRSFSKVFPHYIVKHSSISEVNKEDYLNLFNRWAKNRKVEDKATVNEFNALNRIFNDHFKDLRVVSLFVEEQLVAFTIYEIISKDYAISHFAKSDKSYHKAVRDVINWEEAKIIHSQGIKYFNWEQDLGIPGLRKSKEKYGPCTKFKKFNAQKKQ